MKSIIKSSLLMTLVLIVICGVAYPLLVTGIGQVAFKDKANGSIIEFNGKATGSKLIGQSFTDPRFFQGRVSAVNYNTYTEDDKKLDNSGKAAYTGVASGSANLAPSNPALTERVKKDLEAFLKSHPTIKQEDIPADLLTSSGSGLDPEISPQAARIQIDAVSKASGIDKKTLEDIVVKHTEGRSLGVFGDERVNVLLINLDIADILKGEGKL
ncbi:K(+)-transporting ATPase subunit C [Clostridium folliculivorans]|uniref:Potassium-transporting ATPase KdpC subunit n=1 Tax=Clostridium folliculivorans TaxID=2886038 RepID=A0A9W5XZE1_9CLOT|nr:K(+)-transporting ATPase subunit C [Clostridium folliculivorans]GKU23740.1 potassium-transporting ATPase KdpC subunit [Clostridium folliculivorans]GKU29856.1 potassium-transporting ATPase KdpC subunit [Clostridium folliculivorans]